MSRSILTVPVQRIEGESTTPVQDLLAVEEPLEIRLRATNSETPGKTISITMRTPGQDLELAAGFLFTEGILTDSRQIQNIRYSHPDGNPRQAQNSVTVEVQPEIQIDFERLQRHFYTTSSCGICGKASIEAVHVKGCQMLPLNTPLVHATIVHALPDALRQSQPVFDRTGGLHASALFDSNGTLLSLREDVGRHNALDKLIGAEFLERRTPLNDRILLVSGRASFELIQKAAMAGIPVLAAVGAPSSLAVELAQRFQMTLLGFVRNSRFNIYSGSWRIR